MKKLVTLVIIILIMISNVVYAGVSYPGASSWAIPELQTAYDNGIDNGYSNYGSNISRVQFAELIMSMYYQMKGEYPDRAPIDTFTDTTDKNVLMASKLGIINGKGNGTFDPESHISRQEMAIMMSRTLDSLEIQYDQGDGVLTVADKESVDSWAVAGVDFAFDNGFMKGDGISFGPLNKTPIEQAVIIVNRVYIKYKDSMIDLSHYSKGYDVTIEDGKGYIVYKNGNKLLVRENIVFIDYLKSNNKKLYLVTDSNESYRYDVSTMKFREMPLSTYTQDMRVVQGGKYDGYIAVRTLIKGVTEYRVLTNNSHNSFTGILIDSFDDMNKQIERFKTKGFSFTVDGKKYTTFKSFLESANQIDGFNYLYESAITLLRSSGQKAPYILLCETFDKYKKFNGYGGTYSMDIHNGSDGTYSGGCIFNMTGFDDIDRYTGFKVLVSSTGNGKATISLLVGDGSSEMTIISNNNVTIDSTSYLSNKLKLFKNGNSVDIYMNGTLAIHSESDNYLTSDGFFILFCNNKEITMSNLNIEKLPY